MRGLLSRLSLTVAGYLVPFQRFGMGVCIAVGAVLSQLPRSVQVRLAYPRTWAATADAELASMAASTAIAWACSLYFLYRSTRVPA